ncbi:MAG: MBL fold metallo-hydrolase, partial [Ardenticatenales bacterium]|nr:MBL fold metallo-hydrolase [Ardenticatenales bacterium]
MESSEQRQRVEYLPNNARLVQTRAGAVLVNSPPETLKLLLALGHEIPQIILLPPDIPAGIELGSSGFVRRGINYASVEFLLYSNFFIHNQRTRIITPTAAQRERMAIIINETLVGPANAADFEQYHWLRVECMATSYYAPLNHEPQLEDLTDLRALTDGGGDLGQGVAIRWQDNEYVFLEDGIEVARLPTAVREPASPLFLTPPRPLLRHELTLQFIGGSDGFDPAGITTCFLAFLDPKQQTRVTLFDAAAYLRQRLGNLGVAPHQISELVLSHLHEDHLAGLPELLLLGNHRVRVLTSTIIYRSLLRVLAAMLDRPAGDVAALFEHIPLDPGRPVDLDGRRFEAMYAVHTIPTIAVRVGDLYYSGDMRYDEAWFAELVAQGVLTAARQAELTSFAENAKVIVQDAGGGAIHTT